MRTFTILLALTLIISAMVGCASRTSSNVYSRDQAQLVHHVDEGEIINVRPVEIEGSVSGLGAIAGAIMGYAVGGTIGEGSGQGVATAMGTIGGALLGSAVEEGASHQRGLEITVQLDYGQVIAIIQAADEGFQVGDRVRVLRLADGSARVVQQTYDSLVGLSY